MRARVFRSGNVDGHRRMELARGVPREGGSGSHPRNSSMRALRICAFGSGRPRPVKCENLPRRVHADLRKILQRLFHVLLGMDSVTRGQQHPGGCPGQVRSLGDDHEHLALSARSTTSTGKSHSSEKATTTSSKRLSRANSQTARSVISLGNDVRIRP